MMINKIFKALKKIEQILNLNQILNNKMKKFYQINNNKIILK